MNEICIVAKPIYGRVEIKPCYKFEGDKMFMGGYKIEYDEHGNETNRTEPEFYGSITT